MCAHATWPLVLALGLLAVPSTAYRRDAALLGRLLDDDEIDGEALEMLDEDGDAMVAPSKTEIDSRDLVTIKSTSSKDVAHARNTEDATRADFEMPHFDDLARVRAPQLVELGVSNKVANDMISAFASDSRGIGKAAWIDNKLGAKVQNVLGHVEGVAANVKAEKPDVAAEGETAWMPDGDYETHGSGGPKGNIPIPRHRKPVSSEGAAEVASWSFVEVNAEPFHLQWPSVAVVQSADLQSLKFPSEMARDVSSLGKAKHSITSSEWTDLALEKTLTEFVKRGKHAGRSGANGPFTGDLRFFQIADALPDCFPYCKEGGLPDCFPYCKHGEDGNFVEASQNTATRNHVPTFEEVAAHATGRSGILDLKAKDVEHWLRREQGMKNEWFFWTDRRKHAKNLANDVLQHVTREEFQKIAPRLALYLRLDADRDGRLSFSNAHPYL